MEQSPQQLVAMPKMGGDVGREGERKGEREGGGSEEGREAGIMEGGREAGREGLRRGGVKGGREWREGGSERWRCFRLTDRITGALPKISLSCS